MFTCHEKQVKNKSNNWESKSNNYDQMKLIAQEYASKRECSLQEAVYHIMPELWLRKVFPAKLFANTNLPENKYRVCVIEKEIKQLPEPSTDIFKTIMLDRYKEFVNLELGNIQLRMKCVLLNF